MSEALKKSMSLSLNDIVHKDLHLLKENNANTSIFEIKKIDQIPFGFATQNDLKDFLQQTETQPELMIRNIESTHWIMLFEHPAFQRRKPHLVSIDSLSPEDDMEYFILSQGQKSGPFDRMHLQSMFEKKEILLTDMVSTNAGHTWMKLYQVDGFDRRALKESIELPEIPEHIINDSVDNVINIHPIEKTFSGIVGLGKVKLERQKSESPDKHQLGLEKQQKAESNKSTSMFFKILLVISLVGITYFAFNIKNQLSSPFQSQAPQLGEHSDDFDAEVLTPSQTSDGYQYSPPQSSKGARSVIGEQNNPSQINNEDRFNHRKLNPIKPAIKKSFMETSTFKDQQDAPNEAPVDSNYYYDNTSAMELDPVRAQVSKENYNDPELDSGNHNAPRNNEQIYEQEVAN